MITGWDKKSAWRLAISIFILVTVTGCATRQTLSPHATGITSVQVEEDLVQEINRWRVAQGKSAWPRNEALATLAQKYSKDMAHRHFFAHRDPDGRNLKERLWAAGISFHNCVENLARISRRVFTPAEVLAAWLESPDHRDNLLSDTTQAGIGLFCTEETCFVSLILLKP